MTDSEHGSQRLHLALWDPGATLVIAAAANSSNVTSAGIKSLFSWYWAQIPHPGCQDLKDLLLSSLLGAFLFVSSSCIEL